MSNLTNNLLRSKFRGCFIGSLIGDCFGAPFAGDNFSSSAKIVLQRYFDKLSGPYFKAPVNKYTTNSVTTKCVAQALIENSAKLEPTQLAKILVKEYFNDPRRGYSEGTIDVFHKLRANKFTDPFKPALEQPDTFDNGAALRTIPITLLYHNDFDKMLQIAKTSTELTHAHKHGITGAILHCIAVQQGLLADSFSGIDNRKFIAELSQKLKEVEKDEEGLGIGHPTPFSSQMAIVEELLTNETTDEQVVERLGHSTPAVYSVPTAIYCFLRAQDTINDVNTSDPFRRTLQYAISLGGDTPAIAGMAGSIAGAYYGEEQIGKTMLQHCENNELFSQLADRLFDLKLKHV